MALLQRSFDRDESRLAAPRIRPTSVVKTDVIGRLAASAAPFAMIVAPAGYGKTTLLARWAELDSRPFAWVSLDERDNDPVVFLRDILSAMDRVEPVIPSVFDAVSGPGDTIWHRVPHVGNALAGIKRPMVVALDDFHAVTNEECHSVLAALFDYVPPASLLAVTSRQEPPLPLARWRARGLLFEVGLADLRLDPREAGQLLAGADVTLTEPQVATLAERTEGWPAGLYLAALSLRAGAPIVAQVEGFTGNDRFVSEYFRLEILSRLDDTEARFLVHTSVLETMSGGLCDAVLGRTGSVGDLDRLEQANRFVIALDHEREWYRYHHLFRELLRYELERSDPGSVRVLNRRAMAWCLDRGDLEGAVRYGHAAGETETVATLIDRIALSVAQDGRLETAAEWVGWFNDDDLRRFPALAVYAAWIRATTGHSVEAEHYIALADWGNSVVPLSDGSPSTGPWVATLRAFMMPDGIAQAEQDADVALADLGPTSRWRPVAIVCRGVARALRGSFDLATEDLTVAAGTSLGAGVRDVAFVALAELSLLEAQDGRWRDATRHADEARDLVSQARLDHYVISALVHVAVARVALHDRRQADARAAMTRAHRLRPLLDFGIPWLAVQVANELARAHLALGETDAARSVLEDATAIINRRPHLGSLVQATRELGDRIGASKTLNSGWAVNLTGAELRLLPFLATHLTFPEIARHLFITSHTVRSQAKAIYRKLDASSRTEAIDRAVEVGLLEPTFPHRADVAD